MEIDKLVDWIKNSKKTVFFGGAGVSTESGLKDFRSKDGLYHEKYIYPPEQILSHTFFIHHPDIFYDFYKKKLNSLSYQPNICHTTLAYLEQKGLLSSIITQNIDGFHQMAGSKNVYELHGSIMRNYCLKCGKFFPAETIFNSKEIPTCDLCHEIIKPDVVLYEEALDSSILEKAISEIRTASLLIIGGTSLNVYPAASLIHYFKGTHLVLINKEKTACDSLCDLVIHKSIGEVFNEIRKSL